MKDFLRSFLSSSRSVYAHTSGTTGTPKRIRLLKEDMRASARATNTFFKITSGSVLACPLSTDYIAGKMMAVRGVCAGCTVVSLPVSNQVKIPEDLERVDLLAVVPTQMPSLLLPDSGIERVRNVLVGGAAPDAAHCAAVRARGPRVFISYGMTETCSHVALADASDPERVYHAMPGVTFTLSARGTLTVHTPHLSIGKVETNDMAHLLDSTHFQYLGRADNVVNSGGLKLHPESLEQQFAPHLPGLTFYLTGEPDAELGERLLMVTEGTQEQAETALRTLRTAFTNHKHLPRRAVAYPILPRTASGKLKREH